MNYLYLLLLFLLPNLFLTKLAYPKGVWEMDEYKNLERDEIEFPGPCSKGEFSAFGSLSIELLSSVFNVRDRSMMPLMPKSGRERWDAFVSEVDSIDPSISELEKVDVIYKIVKKYVPQYAYVAGKNGEAVPDDSMGNAFAGIGATVLGTAGICRDQANLLDWALDRNGIDTSIKANSNHAWVHISLKNPPVGYEKEFDLDPTWYDEFTPLNNRYRY